MKRKQRKSLSWRRFDVILIIINFCELLLRICPRIINSLRSYVKHSKECFLLFPNTSKLVKKKSAAPRFSNLLLGVWKSEETLFLVFDLLLNVFWHGVSFKITVRKKGRAFRKISKMYFPERKISLAPFWLQPSPHFRPKRHKNYTLGTAHTYIAYKGEYFLPPLP